DVASAAFSSVGAEAAAEPAAGFAACAGANPSGGQGSPPAVRGSPRRSGTSESSPEPERPAAAAATPAPAAPAPAAAAAGAADVDSDVESADVSVEAASAESG